MRREQKRGAVCGAIECLEAERDLGQRCATLGVVVPEQHGRLDAGQVTIHTPVQHIAQVAVRVVWNRAWVGSSGELAPEVKEVTELDRDQLVLPIQLPVSPQLCQLL